MDMYLFCGSCKWIWTAVTDRMYVYSSPSGFCPRCGNSNVKELGKMIEALLKVTKVGDVLGVY